MYYPEERKNIIHFSHFFFLPSFRTRDFKICSQDRSYTNLRCNNVKDIIVNDCKPENELVPRPKASQKI